jgi:hypothetical protein
MTVEISDALFRDAKKCAECQGITLRAVIERGLRMAIEGEPKSRRRFRLRMITTKGEGLAVDGDKIRSMIYEGHGDIDSVARTVLRSARQTARPSAPRN